MLLFQVCVSVLSAILLSAEAEEERIRAYGTRIDKPVLRIIPSDSVVVRIRKPDQDKPLLGRESSITRVQPIFLTPRQSPKVSLQDALQKMHLRSMASLVARTKLQQYLQNTGPVTLFAPTDEAFSLTTPPSDPENLRQFILQHVVRGRITPEDVRNDITMPSLRAGGRILRLNVYEDGQMLSVSGSQFLDDAIDVDSVRIQPIDRVLYPISNEDLVTETRLSFPVMFQSLLNSSLTPQLTSGTFTLFAPTDTAFQSLSTEMQDELDGNKTLLRRVLLNHVVPGTHYSAVLAHGYVLKTLGGESIRFTNRRGLILANGVPIVKSDISVKNGVIHAINRCLLPPELSPQRRPVTIAPPPQRTPTPSYQSYKPPVRTYLEPPPSIPRTLTKTMVTPLRLPNGGVETFSTANNLFRRSLLLSTIRNNATGEGYTIVMPTDGAFNALEPGALDRLRRNTRLLRRMLQYQMLEGRLNISDGEEKDRPVKSLGGTLIISSLDGGKSYMAGGARVLSIRSAANGLVLVTDRVVFPPSSPTVVEALSPITNLKRIVDTQPATKSLLNSAETTYTVFAPTDSALVSLSIQQQRDQKFLSELFWSHVVPGAFYRSRLAPGLQLTTLRGFTITIEHKENDEVLVNGVPLEGDEIVAGNGVIHKLNRVLFTPEMPQLAPAFAPQVISGPDDYLTAIGQKFKAMQFLDWIEKAQMKHILQNQASRSGGCTLFLPTDSALNGMSPTLRSVMLENRRQLQNFIRFHISPQTLQWGTIANNALLPTLLPGKRIRCNIYATEQKPAVLSFSGCRVSAVQPMNLPNNVTVAVIEGAMSPPLGQMPLVISKSPFLSNFSKILKVAKAEEMLGAIGPFTLFAPDACAFAKMSPHYYQQLITLKKMAQEFLKHYLIRDCYYSSGLLDGQILMTEAGIELIVKVTPDCILISGVRILYGDMSATDGVLHILADQLPS